MNWFGVVVVLGLCLSGAFLIVSILRALEADPPKEDKHDHHA